MCIKYAFALLLCCLLPGLSTATSNVIALSAGPAWYRAGKTQTLSLQPQFANTYKATTPDQRLTSGELFLGLQRSFSNLGFGQLGVTIATSSAAKLRGHIWEAADPEFDNFTYQYTISHVHVAMKTKWLLNRWHDTVLPYVSASLGVALNKASNFSMTPLIFESLTIPGFQSNQNTALTYTLGLGVHIVLNAHWQLGIGYELSDWGNASLRKAPGQTINSGLSLNALFTQQLQFTLNYLFQEHA